jgi:AraC-like DNA-binding protein
MTIECEEARPARIRGSRSATLLLVEGDLGRRATLPVALGTGYVVTAAATADEAFEEAVASVFDVAVLDATVVGRAFPRIVRVLRGHWPGVRLVVTALRGDLRARRYATTLGCDALLGRAAPACLVLDCVDVPLAPGLCRPRFDRSVGRAIDLMARDVTHLLDVVALAAATGVPLPHLAERFRVTTGLTVREYVTRVRVAVAQQFLKDTDLGVVTLAELLGFADANELTALVATQR